MKKHRLSFVLGALCIGLCSFAQDGQSVHNITLQNINNASVAIPGLGEKLMLVIYIDPDVQGISDPITEAVNDKKFPASKLGATGVVNCKDTWIPNKAIKAGAERMQRKYPQSCILLDINHSLSEAWKTGNANDVAIIMLVSSDMKIKYFHKIKNRTEANAIITTLIAKIEQEIR